MSSRLKVDRIVAIESKPISSALVAKHIAKLVNSAEQQQAQLDAAKDAEAPAAEVRASIDAEVLHHLKLVKKALESFE